jgi:transcriptional regulator with XRE-family HTH domain
LESKTTNEEEAMKPSKKEQNEHVSIVLRRMRESAGLTMREVGAMIGVSHVAISQFENRKLDLPAYRIEQLVNAYGLDMADFNKILGRAPVFNPKDDCHAMIDRMTGDQLAIVRGLFALLLQPSSSVSNSKQPN